VPDSIQSSPAGVSKGLSGRADRRLTERVILEILKQLTSGKPTPLPIGRDTLDYVFWLAHLYYAKSHPGYLTTWPLVRTRWGVEIKDAGALLRNLAEEELVRVEQVERGPFLVTVYSATGKDSAVELPAGGVEAIQKAVSLGPVFPPNGCDWPAAVSRAWRATPDGEEMDIYLDLIPEDLYQERRHQLEGLKETLGDLFA
jgi:hypothetical protein